MTGPGPYQILCIVLSPVYDVFIYLFEYLTKLEDCRVVLTLTEKFVQKVYFCEETENKIRLQLETVQVLVKWSIKLRPAVMW